MLETNEVPGVVMPDADCSGVTIAPWSLRDMRLMLGTPA
jgi:hypothetical protein